MKEQKMRDFKVGDTIKFLRNYRISKVTEIYTCFGEECFRVEDDSPDYRQPSSMYKTNSHPELSYELIEEEVDNHSQLTRFQKITRNVKNK